MINTLPFFSSTTYVLEVHQPWARRRCVWVYRPLSTPCMALRKQLISVLGIALEELQRSPVAIPASRSALWSHIHRRAPGDAALLNTQRQCLCNPCGALSGIQVMAAIHQPGGARTHHARSNSCQQDPASPEFGPGGRDRGCGGEAAGGGGGNASSADPRSWGGVGGGGAGEGGEG